MVLSGFVIAQRSTDIETARFKYWWGTIGYSNPKIKSCSQGPGHYKRKTISIFANSITVSNRGGVPLPAPRTLLHQQIHSARVNIHSNKIPLTPPSPSGHLKHSPCGHHKFSLSIFRNIPLAHLLPSFGYSSQVLELCTYSPGYRQGLATFLQPPLPLKTLSATLQTSSYPTPTRV